MHCTISNTISESETQRTSQRRLVTRRSCSVISSRNTLSTIGKFFILFIIYRKKFVSSLQAIFSRKLVIFQVFQYNFSSKYREWLIRHRSFKSSSQVRKMILYNEFCNVLNYDSKKGSGKERTSNFHSLERNGSFGNLPLGFLKLSRISHKQQSFYWRFYRSKFE
jgi:hypothetical protein